MRLHGTDHIDYLAKILAMTIQILNVEVNLAWFSISSNDGASTILPKRGLF